MRHASTIAMARTLLQRGRAGDVLRMLAPLADNAAAGSGDVVVHSLLARTYLLAYADVERAAHHLKLAHHADTAPPASAVRDLWEGWLCAWPLAEHFRPAVALARLHRSHATAASYDAATRTWAHLGCGPVYLPPRPPPAAGPLPGQGSGSGWLRARRGGGFRPGGLGGGVAVLWNGSGGAGAAITGMGALIGSLSSPLY